MINLEFYIVLYKYDKIYFQRFLGIVQVRVILGVHLTQCPCLYCFSKEKKQRERREKAFLKFPLFGFFLPVIIWKLLKFFLYVILQLFVSDNFRNMSFHTYFLNVFYFYFILFHSFIYLFCLFDYFFALSFLNLLR